VHLPFCRSRCHYCAFFFVVGRAELREDYRSALEREIDGWANDPRWAGRPVESVYFGGGTPSLMEPAAVDRLVKRADLRFGLLPGAEISLEANPDDLELSRLEGFRAAGCNRLSLGWQSTRRENLRALTRTHGPEDNRAALERARDAGFGNVGVDLIFGLPGQTSDSWLGELDEVAASGPEHVSAYELTFEEGTRLTRRHREGRFAVPDDDERARMFEGAEDVLQGHGIRRYEISNFARPGHECVHNVSGWKGGDVLGVGASAASHFGASRWTNVADLDDYVARAGSDEGVISEIEELDETTCTAEELYLGLRTTEGVLLGGRIDRLPQAEGRRLLEVLDRAQASGWLLREGDRVRLTRAGRLFADTVFDQLLGG
jgi:oxygen-independent coproporphyrinogen-3 oxidase